MRQMMAVLIAGAVLAAAGSVRAEGKGTFSVWGQFARPSFSKLNDQIDDDVATDKANGATSAEGTNIESAFGGGIGFGYEVDDITSIGFRVGYLRTNEGGTESKMPNFPFADDVSKVNIVCTAIPLLVGGALRQEVNDHLSVHAALFGGIALTGVTYDSTFNSSSLNIEAGGNAFDAEVSVGADMKMTDSTSLGLDIGYRLLTSTASYTNDVAGTTLKEGDQVKDSKGDPAKYEWSGLFVTLGLTLHL